MTRRLLQRVAFAAVACGVLAAPRVAHAQSAEACADAAESGQRLRDQGKLVESRAHFATCGASSCPSAIARECVRWIEDVDARIPQVIIGARDRAGRDVAATLSVDDRSIAAVAGRALPLDPGPHVFRARTSDGRTTEERVVVLEREKDRRIVLTFADVATGVAPPTPAPVTPAGRRVPVLSWALGGVALAGAGGFALLWSGAVSRAHELRDTCAPACDASDVDSVAMRADLARVSLGVGIAAAVGAVVVYVLQPSRAPAGTGAAAAPNVWVF